jgi:hypothetical protein
MNSKLSLHLQNDIPSIDLHPNTAPTRRITLRQDEYQAQCDKASGVWNKLRDTRAAELTEAEEEEADNE